MCKLQTTETFESSLADFLDKAEESEVHDYLSDDGDKITNKEEANYFIRKVKEMTQAIQNINDTADQEIEKQTKRINEWRDQSTRSYSYMIEEYTKRLRDYWIEYGNNKTIKLSQGSLCMRKMKDKEEYNVDLIGNFLERNILYQYTNRVPDKTKIKEKMVVNPDGTVSIPDGTGTMYQLEGFTVKKQEPRFEVK